MRGTAMAWCVAVSALGCAPDRDEAIDPRGVAREVAESPVGDEIVDAVVRTAEAVIAEHTRPVDRATALWGFIRGARAAFPEGCIPEAAATGVASREAAAEYCAELGHLLFARVSDRALFLVPVAAP